jgi:hypothetical protein
MRKDMRALRFGMTCTAATCAAGALLATLTNCEDDPNIGTGTFDGSSPAFDAPPGSDATPIPLPDGGVDAAPTGCTPASMAGFVPPPYVPARNQTFDCNDYQNHSQTMALANVCFADASTVAACAAFPDAGVLDGAVIPPACATCLRRDEADTDGGYGASISLRGTITVANVAGCVQIANDSDAGFACAQALQAAAICVDRSCRDSCPVTNETTRDAYIACTKAAAATSCSTFAQAAAGCAAAEVDAGDRAREFCFSSADPVANFDKIAAFFCTS